MLDEILSYFQRYFFQSAGIIYFGQMINIYILSVNPAIFKLFSKRHYALFFMGSALCLINARALLPFMLLILLDLDYAKLGKREKLFILLFFMAQVFIFLVNSKWGYGS